jgi:ubiquinone/menaquinone biosynthesis C-methylase UbiE
MNKWSYKRRVMQRYDLTASMYDELYAEEQVVKYHAALKHLKAYGSVLDAGCGTGHFLSNIAEEVEIAVGVDISIRLLLQAKEQARTFPNFHLVQADADYLPFIDACFNLVFAFTVLQNMPNPRETLMEIKRNAKRDALITVTGLKKAFSLEAFRVLLQKAGLQVVHIEDADVLKCHVAVTI